MAFFPDTIQIQIKQKRGKIPLEDIIVYITMIANHKNNYSMAKLTNNQGMITFMKEEIANEIVKTRNMYIMDFSSTIDDLKEHIIVRVLSVGQVNEYIGRLEIYADEEYENSIKKLKRAKNKNKKPIEKMIEFNQREFCSEIILV